MQVRFTNADLESGQAPRLYPKAAPAENAARWGFVFRVYCIVLAQLVLTAVSVLAMTHAPAAAAQMASSVAANVAACAMPVVLLVPLFLWRQSSPANLVLLLAWTLSVSLLVGLACALHPRAAVAEALVMTAASVLALTVYAFRATAHGEEFDFMGPSLHAGLATLVVYSLMVLFIGTTRLLDLTMAAAGALVFCGYVILDTFRIIKRFPVDEYVWASVGLYLDVINMFLELLKVLKPK
jgi:hypothetical protein